MGCKKNCKQKGRKKDTKSKKRHKINKGGMITFFLHKSRHDVRGKDHETGIRHAIIPV